MDFIGFESFMEGTTDGLATLIMRAASVKAKTTSAPH
jgi:hypothetical protein